MRYASFGSISHGTLRDEDLLDTFAGELDSLLKLQPRSFKRAPYRAKIREAYATLRAMEHGPEDEHSASDVVADLQDALNDFAPPYGYFGSNEGDGSDFGFWLSDLDSFDGLRVDDTSEIPPDYRGEVLHVSDHGNLSLYVATARGKLRSVWAVV